MITSRYTAADKLQREHDDPRSILTDVERINEIFQGIAAHQFDPGFGSVVQRFLLVGIELKVYVVGVGRVYTLSSFQPTILTIATWSPCSGNSRDMADPIDATAQNSNCACILGGGHDGWLCL